MRTAYGLTALEDQYEDVLKRTDAIEDEIQAISADSVAGLLIKLKLATHWNEEQENRGRPFKERTYPNRSCFILLPRPSGWRACP
jgi:hypothetical protein